MSSGPLKKSLRKLPNIEDWEIKAGISPLPEKIRGMSAEEARIFRELCRDTRDSIRDNIRIAKGILATTPSSLNPTSPFAFAVMNLKNLTTHQLGFTRLISECDGQIRRAEEKERQTHPPA
jgi:hypothetical protein